MSWSEVTGGDFNIAPHTLPTAADGNQVWEWQITAANVLRYVRVIAIIGGGTNGMYPAILADILPYAPSFADTGAAQICTV
jgi:hypothetical protein